MSKGRRQGRRRARSAALRMARAERYEAENKKAQLTEKCQLRFLELF